MTQAMHRTDHELQQSIEAELAWTQSVTSDHIGVAVNLGAVTLSGQVMSYPEKEAAVAAALRVRGVRAIVDDVVVHHSFGQRQDADIAREANSALENSVQLSDAQVSATVHNHIITLTGELSWDYQRAAARNAVSSLPGVTGVWNEITIRPKAVATPFRARADIKAALVRNAEVDADNIDVSVDASTVTLSGTVSSWSEAHKAELAAWFSAGVSNVENNLSVSP